MKQTPSSPKLHPDFLRDLPLMPLLELAFEGIALFDESPSRMIFANATLRRWLALPSGNDELMPNISGLVTMRGGIPLADWLNEAMHSDNQDSTSEAVLSNDDRPPVTLLVRACRLLVDARPIVALLLQRIEDKSLTADGSDVPCRDALTGLHDRAFLLSRLAALMRGDRQGDQQFAVLFIDLDNFKHVNDTHGHLVGDLVLREAAKRLAGCVRDDDHVVRFGGDEFVVVAERVATAAEIEPITARIHAVLAEPVALPGGEFRLSVSIGAALASPEFESPKAILHAADRAMYAAKRASG